MTNNKTKLPRLIALGFLALCLLPAAHAGLYKCTDKNGKTYYQDKPCQDLITKRLPSYLTSLSGREEERAFLWKATGEKGTLYLLGAPHYGAPTFYPLPQMVMDAFANSQSVVVETNLWDLGERELDRESLLRVRGRYDVKPDGMDDHVKPVTWDKVVEAGKKLGFNEEQLRQYKPWRAALMLTAESLKQAGYTPDLGIAQTFLREAQGKKPTSELNIKEEQIKQLDALSDREQEQLLLQTLQDLARAPDIYKNIAEAWKKGDMESMDQIVRQSYDATDASAKLSRVFFEDINEGIAARLKEMAADDKTIFVVLSADRFGGDRGVLRLLEEKKFTVSQP